MKILSLIISLLIISKSIHAQTSDTANKGSDSVTLQSVNVSAFTSERSKLKDVPASISVLDINDLQRFSGTSLVSAMNTVPGVRMEERSPESYRLSIRGSLLRSPFGVRDIKIYWDDIPLTDASGNTYLNLVDLNHLQSIEILKGPTSSFYGANTGGVVLLHSATNIGVLNKKNLWNFSVTGGMYGSLNEEAGWRAQRKNFFSNLQQSHQQSIGYRSQTANRKDVIKWNGIWTINAKNSLSFLAFYADLYLQTPGALTQQQLDEDPSQARPVNASKNASTRNRTPFAAITYKSILNEHFTNTTSVVLDHTSFINPATADYEIRSEWNYSARTFLAYLYQKNNFSLQALAGGEYQYNNSHIDDYNNNAGNRSDTVQFKDIAHVAQYFLFAHVNMSFNKKFLIQTGVSRNTINYWYDRTTDNTIPYPVQKTSGPVLAPRFSALYKLNKFLSVYASVAKGFSPPALAEIIPSNGNFYNSLEPEYGWNYEAGIKGSLIPRKLDIITSVYYFGLKDAIVIKHDSTGSEYFINAGSTIQKGAELWLKAYLFKNGNKFISKVDVWNSLTYQPYYFGEYEKDSDNYSGNQLTGVPRFVNIIGIDINAKKGFYCNITFNCTSSIPLNDSNTVFSKPYQLLQCKIGKQFLIKQYACNAYFGVDNALDEHYSLGNDINAAGDHYFNPAPLINFYAGMKINL